jgi:hypothetical protein
MADNDNLTYGVMPSGERQSIPDRYQIQSDSAHVKVRELSAYDFVLDTYEGANGYRDGSYLIPHPREQFYETRRESSYYVNAYAPVIDAMVVPVFNSEIERNTTNDAYLDFIENCDACGTPLQQFMEVCITHARMMGVTFIVMDNFQSQSDTMAAALEKREYPYVYERLPQSMRCKEVDQWGRLVSISFFDQCREINGKEEKLYREWDSNTWTLYFEDVDKNGNPQRVTVEEGTHGLGVIPVIPILGFSKTNSLKDMPNPPTYDLAMLTFALFNKESQVVTLEQFQAFSLLVTSDFDVTSLTIGPSTFINCGKDAKFAPQYISPNTANITTMVDNCERLKEEIYKQAGQKGVIGIKTETSGVAKEWDFRAEEAVLKKTAMVAEETEETIANIFSLYIGTDVDCEIVYPSKFSPSYETNRINDAIKIIQQTPPEEVTTELWKEVVQSFWSNDKDTAAMLIESIDEPEEDVSDEESEMRDEEGQTEAEMTEEMPMQKEMNNGTAE